MFVMRPNTEAESDTFRRAGARAKAEGLGLRALVLRLFELYARVGLAPLERAAGGGGGGADAETSKEPGPRAR